MENEQLTCEVNILQPRASSGELRHRAVRYARDMSQMQIMQVLPELANTLYRCIRQRRTLGHNKVTNLRTVRNNPLDSVIGDSGTGSQVQHPEVIKRSIQNERRQVVRAGRWLRLTRLCERVNAGRWDDLFDSRWKCGVGEAGTMSEAHLAHVLAMYPQVSNPEVADVSASIEVDFEEIGTGLCESGDSVIVYGFDVAELNPAEKVTVFGEGGDALWRDCSATSEVDALQAFARSRKGGDGLVCRLDYACEVDSDEIGAS